MKRIVLSLLVAVIVATSVEAAKKPKVLTRCDIAKALKKAGLPKNKLNDWVCLVESESQGNTGAVRSNAGGDKAYGLFAIPSSTACDEAKKGKLCKLQCKSLTNSNLSDDVKCAKKIFKARGFDAWPGWVRSCKGGKAPNVASCLT